MKKLSLIAVMTLLLIIVFSVPVSAATPTSSLVASSSSIHAGETVTVTVKMSNCSSTSLGIIPSYDTTNFELGSGAWLVSGAVFSDFSDGCAVIAYTNSYNFNGDVFKFELKAKSGAKVDKFTVKCEVSAEGYSVVNPSTTVSVVCKTHSYSSWAKVNDSQHKHTCSVCGNVETVNHTWNGGTVTKSASCKETGIRSYTCTGCGATKTETISKTNDHKYGAWSIAKQPTCTDKGTQVRTCSVCGKVETKEVAALGHSFSNPTVTKEPTCTETGIETGVCTRCGKESTNQIPAKGHSFEDPITVKEATDTEEGLITRKCSICGETVEEVIPAKSSGTSESSEITSSDDPATSSETNTDTEVVADKTGYTENGEKFALPLWSWLAVAAGIILAIVIIILIIVKRKKNAV